MCRLYGYLSEQPTRIECGLVCSQNSILRQSVADGRGLPNPDGWGLAYYVDGKPHLRHKAASASQDPGFPANATRIYTHALVAHVRRASVGAPSLANTHPFRAGRWVFAHNGTIPGFEAIQRRMESEIPAALMRLRRGTTDSELCFLWALARLEQVVPGAIKSGAPQKTVVPIVREAIRQIVAWCRLEGIDETPGLNFVLSDGHGLTASRLGATLYVLRRRELGTCELCKTCHCPRCRERGPVVHVPMAASRAFVVASEPLTDEDWVELPEARVIGVDERLQETQVPC
jgi:predicted glutamine amidotransferase